MTMTKEIRTVYRDNLSSIFSYKFHAAASMYTQSKGCYGCNCHSRIGY